MKLTFANNLVWLHLQSVNGRVLGTRSAVLPTSVLGYGYSETRSRSKCPKLWKQNMHTDRRKRDLLLHFFFFFFFFSFIRFILPCFDDSDDISARFFFYFFYFLFLMAFKMFTEFPTASLAISITSPEIPDRRVTPDTLDLPSGNDRC